MQKARIAIPNRGTHPIAATQSAEKRRAAPSFRHYDVSYLDRRGDICERQQLAPAHPAFENACSAFARGLMFQTKFGPIAVEDLLPGDEVQTASGDFKPILWKGMMTLVPGGEGLGNQLTRIRAEALGLNRPPQDAVFGPAARIYQTTPQVRSLTDAEGAFVPAADLVDGEAVIALRPIAPVRVYHIGLERHERLVAGGFEVESHHPGAPHRFPLRGAMLDVYMSLFPHLGSLADFGMPAWARVRLRAESGTDSPMNSGVAR